MRLTCHICGAPQLTDLERDGRATKWRIRGRLYDQQRPDEPAFDTDADLEPGEPGTMEVAGLKGMCDELLQLAIGYHGTAQLAGMTTEILDAKLPGLRPTLSRNKGRAVFRVPYDTPQTWSADKAHRPGWLARVDLVRVEVGATAPAVRSLRRVT